MQFYYANAFELTFNVPTMMRIAGTISTTSLASRLTTRKVLFFDSSVWQAKVSKDLKTKKSKS